MFKRKINFFTYRFKFLWLPVKFPLFTYLPNYPQFIKLSKNWVIIHQLTTLIVIWMIKLFWFWKYVSITMSKKSQNMWLVCPAKLVVILNNFHTVLLLILKSILPEKHIKTIISKSKFITKIGNAWFLMPIPYAISKCRENIP